jgi:glycosyltransferase involved in cell wall biosynthesis
MICDRPLSVPSVTPLVSIIVNNFNYAPYLAAAIDSALHQTYSQVEVIVVDDGSTDRSKEVILNYGDRITPIFKANGGQASSFNTGFAAARGEMIIFLDSDDVLLPDIVADIVTCFQNHPQAVKVQYSLQVIDAQGNPKDEVHPSIDYHLPTDLQSHILKFYNYAWAPTSGNAFKAEILRQILPMPTEVHQIAADAYLNLITAVYGEVVPLRRIGGGYRVHGQNGFYFGRHEVDLAQLRRLILITAEIQTQQRELFQTLYQIDAKTLGKWDCGSFKNKAILLKLSPETYPFTDRLSILCWQGCIAILHNPVGWRAKVSHIVWFALVPFVSTPIAHILTNALLYPESRRLWLQQAKQRLRARWTMWAIRLIE